MSRVAQAWNRFWFAPRGPKRLGITRALVFGGLAAIYAQPGGFAAWGSVSRVFYQPPAFPLPVAPEGWLSAFHALWILSLALSAVGLFTRVATAAAFVLGGYLIAIDGSFGRVHHNDLAVVLALGVMALSRAGDAFSIDAIRRRAPAPPSGEYRWPLRAIQLVLATVFFAAGMSKLRHAGLAWVTTDNLRMHILERSYVLIPSANRGLVLARFPLLCNAVAAATLAIELLYVVALVSARARVVLIPASLLMLLGIAVFFGPRFTTFVVLSAAWVPWDRGRYRVLFSRIPAPPKRT